METSRGVPTDELRAQLRALADDGYVVLPKLIDEAQCALLRAEAARLASHTGRNPFEGHKTQRVYSPLAKTRSMDVLVDHPRVLALLDALLMPNYLLSQAQIINLLPGEAAQPLHHDDAFYPLPRSFRAVHAAFICAIDRFTSENGATVVVPKSHVWEDRVPERHEAIPCELEAGSAVFFLGNLWHGGGENRSTRDRLAVTCQYCDPWLRQHENFFLEIPPQQARTLRKSILSLLGYSIHPPFMGMVDGRHPLRVLDTDDSQHGAG
jgi:ectoine hydroxylase-related dioxygenase (phytanoyl-CoA dioxygenase family)